MHSLCTKDLWIKQQCVGWLHHEKIDTQEYQATLCHQILQQTHPKCNRNVWQVEKSWWKQSFIPSAHFSVAQGLSGRAGNSWRWTTCRKTCHKKKWKHGEGVGSDKVWSVIDRKFDGKTKFQSEEWHIKNSLWPKKVRNSKSKIKLLLIYLLLTRIGAQNVCASRLNWYPDLLRSAWTAMKRILCIWTDIADAWLLYHDRMSCHNVLSVWKFFDIQEHCSGSAATTFPISVPMWLFSFLTIKNHPWGHFEIFSNIIREL